METEGADEGPAEAEAELSEYNYADGYGYDYNRAKSSPSGGGQNRWGTFGHTIWPSASDAGWPSNRAQNAKIEQFGTGNSNANIGQFGGGKKMQTLCREGEDGEDQDLDTDGRLTHPGIGLVLDLDEVQEELQMPT